MSLAGVDVQALEGVLGDGVAGHHAADRDAHRELGLLLHEDAVLGLLEAADPAGVSTVILLLHLVAGEDRLGGVDDDDVVAAISVRGVGDLELAAQQIGCRHGGLAHGLAGSVDNVPLTLDVALVRHKSGHGVFPPFEIYHVGFRFTFSLFPVKIGTRLFIALLCPSVNTILI